MKKLLCVVLLYTFFACQQNNSTSPEIKKLDQLIIDIKQSLDVPGFAVGVIKDGKVFYKGAHGVQGKDSQEPLTTKSMFHMASVSKPFVATCIVQLAEKGKIVLDEKLTYYLPYFKMADDRYKDITIRQMLMHTSGIPDVEDYEWDKPQYDDEAAERFARSHESIELDFIPGEKFNYSNAAFDILVDVIAKVSKMSFEAYVKQNIFAPVGMVNSTFYHPDVPANVVAKPHILGDSLKMVVSEVYPFNRRHAGSSTLNSCIEDMLLWAEVNLNKGVINGKRIYSEESYNLLTQTQFKINDKASVGLSWFLRDQNGDKKIYHNGGDLGFTTYFAFIPEQKSALVFMTNIDGFWRGDASDILLKYTFYNDSLKWKNPISYKLRKYALNEGIVKVREVYLAAQNTPEEYLVETGFLDDLGYELLDRGYSTKALEVFQFMTELEPEHAGWVDSVADAYRAMDSIDTAIKWYEKALEMKPDQEFSRKKLNELLNK